MVAAVGSSREVAIMEQFLKFLASKFEVMGARMDSQDCYRSSTIGR